MLFDQILAGLIAGSVYSLMAIGYSLVFASTRLLHFAQGDLLMLGGFVGLSLVGVLGRNPLAVMLGVLVVVASFGFVLERFAYRPIPVRLTSVRIISTIGVGLALRNLAAVAWTASAVALPENFFPGPSLVISQFTVRPVYYWVMGLSLTLMVVLALFLSRTRLGLAVRATAYNAEIAELMGMNSSLAKSVSFTIAAGLTGLGGVLVAPLTFIHYEMGVSLGLTGFAAAVLGGLGSIPGAIVGGYALGLIETFGAGFISSGYKDSIAFVVLILILLLKPSGLLGVPVQEKV